MLLLLNNYFCINKCCNIYRC